MCVFSFDDGMVAASWYAWLALRSRVSMSAIGSVIVMGVLPSSPRFHTQCAWACRRTGGCPGSCSGARRPARRGPAARWCLPAGLAHAGELPGVRHLAQADPAQAELAEDGVRTTAPLATGVATDGELRL